MIRHPTAPRGSPTAIRSGALDKCYLGWRVARNSDAAATSPSLGLLISAASCACLELVVHDKVYSAMRRANGMAMTRRAQFKARWRWKRSAETARSAIAAKHEVHPNQVSGWKRQAQAGLQELFAARPTAGRPRAGPSPLTEPIFYQGSAQHLRRRWFEPAATIGWRGASTSPSIRLRQPSDGAPLGARGGAGWSAPRCGG